MNLKLLLHLSLKHNVGLSSLVIVQTIGKVSDVSKIRCGMTYLAKEAGVSTAAMTGLVDRLEKQGFVTRDRDTNDRRNVYVALTADGVKLHREVLRTMNLAIQPDYVLPNI